MPMASQNLSAVFRGKKHLDPRNWHRSTWGCCNGWMSMGIVAARVEICAACIHGSFCSTKMHLKNEFRMAEKIIRSNKSPLCHYDLLQSFQEIERWKTHPVAFFYVPSDETCHTTLRIPRRLPFWVKSVNIGNFGW